MAFDPEAVVEHLFYIICKEQNKFNLEEKYFIIKSFELPNLEISSLIFADKGPGHFQLSYSELCIYYKRRPEIYASVSLEARNSIFGDHHSPCICFKITELHFT